MANRVFFFCRVFNQSFYAKFGHFAVVRVYERSSLQQTGSLRVRLLGMTDPASGDAFPAMRQVSRGLDEEHVPPIRRKKY